MLLRQYQSNKCHTTALIIADIQHIGCVSIEFVCGKKKKNQLRFSAPTIVVESMATIETKKFKVVRIERHAFRSTPRRWCDVLVKWMDTTMTRDKYLRNIRRNDWIKFYLDTKKIEKVHHYTDVEEGKRMVLIKWRKTWIPLSNLDDDGELKQNYVEENGLQGWN